MSAMCQALSWVLSLSKMKKAQSWLGKLTVTDQEEKVFAEPCNRLPHAHAQTAYWQLISPTHRHLFRIFAGENKSSSEATVTWLKPSLMSYPFAVDVGKTSNIQAKSSGDPHGSGGAESPVFPFGFKYSSYNRC